LTIADITDGHGTHLLASILTGTCNHSTPYPNQWPWQVAPTVSPWTLWREALITSLTSNDLLKLMFSLGHWQITPNSWSWYWVDQDECLYEWVGQSWQVWLLHSHAQFYGQ